MPPRPETSPQFARVAAILRRLPSEPASITTPVLHRRLTAAGYTIPIRILHNDLNRISRELPVRCTPGKPSRWAWLASAAPFDNAALEPAGALLLALMKPIIQSMLPPRVTRHFDTLFGRALESADAAGYGRLIRNVRVLPEALPRQRPLPKPGHVDTLMNALVEGRRVQARYKKRNALAPLDYHLGPLGLVGVGPRLLLLAKKIGAEGVRHYEVQRFTSIRITEGKTQGLDDFDVDAHIADGELAFPISEAWLDLELELGPEHEDELIDAPLAPNQTVTGEPGARRLRARVADTWALQRFILGLGREARVVAPNDYAARMADEVASMAHAYGVAGSTAADPRDHAALKRGLLVPAAVRSTEVLALMSELTCQLVLWARPRGALVLGPGYRLADGVGADLTVFGSGEAEGAPDLVVDVLDGTLDGRARVRKAAWYLAQGVAERWVVDPAERVAMRYLAAEGGWLESGTVDVEGGLSSEALGLDVELRL